MDPDWIDSYMEETRTDWEKKYEADAEKADAEWEDNYLRRMENG